MPFKRFVEPGRVAFISDGPYKGRTCCIVDCVDQKSVLVDGPETGVPRQKLRLSQIHLTKFKLNYPFTAPTRLVRRAWEKNEMDKQWAESRWAERLVNKKRRAELTDFERFKLKRVKSIRNKIRTEEYKKLLKRLYNPIKKSKQHTRAKKRAIQKKIEAGAGKGKVAAKKAPAKK